MATHIHSHDTDALLAGALDHLSRYLQTGCPRAAELAHLLLDRLNDGSLDQELATSCAHLDETLMNRNNA
ncbi:MAG TPA: hypothetical protein PLR02_14050 [Rhodocyclaceae bacterium]|nr:hypothetical protein [Rhodocyclaceae bacterium]